MTYLIVTKSDLSYGNRDWTAIYDRLFIKFGHPDVSFSRRDIEYIGKNWGLTGYFNENGSVNIYFKHKEDAFWALIVII